ncbi:MAG: 4Fe-4S binding protein [Clostridiales bacterium]|nr:4Fe-4S binding protein [Clostridiales bacterium]
MTSFFGLFPDGDQEPVANKQDQTLVVNKYRCPENHPCPSIRVCPVGALKQSGYAAPTVDESKCTKCGRCIRYCPMRAISLQ